MLRNPNRNLQLFSPARSIILLFTHQVSSQLKQRGVELVEYNMFYLRKLSIMIIMTPSGRSKLGAGLRLALRLDHSRKVLKKQLITCEEPSFPLNNNFFATFQRFRLGPNPNPNPILGFH